MRKNNRANELTEIKMNCNNNEIKMKKEMQRIAQNNFFHFWQLVSLDMPIRYHTVKTLRAFKSKRYHIY